MQRKTFLKQILGASIFVSLDGFSSLANVLTSMENKQNYSSRFASFGAIHLNNTSLEKSTLFWTKIVGMKLRKGSEQQAEFGTEHKTLVVVHQTAKFPYAKGYSGLYHVAIHAANKTDFANMLNRLLINNYPFSPVDHTMSKSFYLEDPDGITIEFTLETPERFKRVISSNGLRIEGTDGTIRSASDFLDIKEVMKEFNPSEFPENIAEETFIGHLHLYAKNIEESFAFYKQIGLIEFNYYPEYLYADLGAGGAYQHRIALNSWHGKNRPLAPTEYAGMKHFQLNFDSSEKIEKALNANPNYKEKEGLYYLLDPSGNTLIIKKEA